MFGSRTTLRFRLNVPGKVRVIVTPAGAKKAVRAYTVTGRLGQNRITLSRVRKGKSLAPGKYTVRVRPAGTKRGVLAVRVKIV